MTDRECAMTSRTNRQSEGRNQGDPIEGSPGDLEQRRQHAVKRYLAGDPIEVICQEMGCSKSWLYKWKNRYQAAEPTWSQERSRRPKTSPGKTLVAIEAEIVRLRQTVPDHIWSRERRYSVEPGEIGLTTVEQTGEGLHQNRVGRLAKLTARVTK